MRSDRLPLSGIPNTSRLFIDHVSDYSKVAEWYPQDPSKRGWLKTESADYPQDRRSRVADLLEKQNRGFGAGEKTLANIQRLRAGASAVVTGQQVGLFGGPLYSILKAITAIKIAVQTTEAGRDCVPVFWIATEDHDFAEVDHAKVVDQEWELRRVTAGSKHTEA